MRSTIIAAALALSVSAFPSPRNRGLSAADTLVARAPQVGLFKGRGESNNNEDAVSAWSATIPKSSPKRASRQVTGPASPKAVARSPKGSSPNRPPPRSAPWSPPKAQQPKPIPSPPKEPPFPDAEEDDEKIKAVNRMQREPNAWELDQ
ncbi:hypothetical protein BLS_009614 [Venturia inaequalis]|uniref:Uncharacterized protein n=1 Tax=Venturia inaequalis TaxID=5025 RepID=A0A8H3U4Q4_VENIN|nr:hypothetical protein BLS_009614 [Venturia inaequalis]KAE9979599.1 hypothetical protein EG328_000766 [Venturia inaequalis]KAE9989993.1 hypothetical protein EG327_001961 [Venturia inaequalis]RDI79464.1 hypothetical protein Vi05172_g10615 [Venturia inaequalis]